MFRPQAAWESGDAPCRRADVHPRYACDNKKRTKYGVASMPDGIFPGLGFGRQGAAGLEVPSSGPHTALALLGVTPCTHRKMRWCKYAAPRHRFVYLSCTHKDGWTSARTRKKRDSCFRQESLFYILWKNLAIQPLTQKLYNKNNEAAVTKSRPFGPNSGG